MNKWVGGWMNLNLAAHTASEPRLPKGPDTENLDEWVGGWMNSISLSEPCSSHCHGAQAIQWPGYGEKIESKFPALPCSCIYQMFSVPLLGTSM